MGALNWRGMAEFPFFGALVFVAQKDCRYAFDRPKVGEECVGVRTMVHIGRMTIKNHARFSIRIVIGDDTPKGIWIFCHLIISFLNGAKDEVPWACPWVSTLFATITSCVPNLVGYCEKIRKQSFIRLDDLCTMSTLLYIISFFS
jgi:hypothetical protein